MIPHKNPHEGEAWASMRARLFTQEELEASKERVKRILQQAEARERRNLAKQENTKQAQAEAHAVASA